MVRSQEVTGISSNSWIHRGTCGTLGTVKTLRYVELKELGESLQVVTDSKRAKVIAMLNHIFAGCEEFDMLSSFFRVAMSLGGEGL